MKFLFLPWSYNPAEETITDAHGSVIGRMEPASGPYAVKAANAYAGPTAVLDPRLAEAAGLLHEAREHLSAEGCGNHCGLLASIARFLTAYPLTGSNAQSERLPKSG